MSKNTIKYTPNIGTRQHKQVNTPLTWGQASKRCAYGPWPVKAGTTQQNAQQRNGSNINAQTVIQFTHACKCTLNVFGVYGGGWGGGGREEGGRRRGRELAG